MRARRSLKEGMDSAIIKAMSQNEKVMAAQVPKENQVRWDICFVPRKRRTYMYFEATWPYITPARRI